MNLTINNNDVAFYYENEIKGRKLISDCLDFRASDEQFAKVKELYNMSEDSLKHFVSSDCQIPFRFSRKQLFELSETNYFRTGVIGLWKLLGFMGNCAFLNGEITVEDYEELILKRVKIEMEASLVPMYERIKKEAEENNMNIKDFSLSDDEIDKDTYKICVLWEKLFHSLIDSINWIKSQEKGEKIINEYFIPIFNREETKFVFGRYFTTRKKIMPRLKSSEKWFHYIEDKYTWSTDFIKKHIRMFSISYVINNKLYLKPLFREDVDNAIKDSIRNKIIDELLDSYPEYIKCFDIDIKFDSNSFYLLNELDAEKTIPLEAPEEMCYEEEKDSTDINLFYVHSEGATDGVSGFLI